jgi:hypothetical protein
MFFQEKINLYPIFVPLRNYKRVYLRKRLEARSRGPKLNILASTEVQWPGKRD